MPFFKTGDLKIWTGGEWKKLSKDIIINAFSIDSRTLQKGDAFVCLKDKRDGHDFAKSAQQAGAVAIIAEHEIEDVTIPTLVVKDSLKALQIIAKMHRLRLEYPVIGISGSCGKTFTKELLAKILSWRKPCYSEKNLNNQIGVALSLTKADVKNNNLAIIEAGISAPNEMKVLADMIEPDIAIITNVAAAHLEGFGEVSQVAKEKAVLPEHCTQGGFCVIPANLLSWKSFDELKCQKAVALPMEAPEIKADLVFRYELKFEENFCKMELCLEGGSEYYFELPAMSKGNAEDAVLAVITALMLGCKEEIIYSGLQKIENIGLRNLFIDGEKAKFFVDCYNANPASMKDSLDFFESKTSNSECARTFVLGSMAELGIATLRHHKDIATHIQKRDGDKIILIGDNSKIYFDALIEKGWSESDIKICQTSQEAKSDLENAEGYVFLKGSRKYELEKALPEQIANSIANHISIETSTQEDDDTAIQDYTIEEPKDASNKDDDKDDDDDDTQDFEDDENETDDFVNLREDSDKDDEDERF